MREYLAIIEPAEDGTGFGAFVPDLPGCIATGRTRAEAKERIAYSILLHTQSLRAHGEPVPPARGSGRANHRCGVMVLAALR
jgi:predicted RNase H-like HicB family nuclease